MSKNKTTTAVALDPFQAWAHRWGRVGTLIALVYMISLPFIVLNYFHCVPSLGAVFNVATFGILSIYVPVGISEALSYTPLMGASSYLGFITGNIMNAFGSTAGSRLAIGGTSIIIVVGVALETVKALEAQLMMRHYKGFLE